MPNINNSQITGTQLNYYLVCKRKLWLFSRGIGFEKNNENVDIGKLIHDKYFKRKKKELQIGPVKIDFIDNRYSVVHEVKKTSKLSDVSLWQTKYYLYYLKKNGINACGEIHIPEERKKIRIDLVPEDEDRLEEFLNDIRSIVDSARMPDMINSRICKKCAYYEFCYVE